MLSVYTVNYCILSDVFFELVCLTNDTHTWHTHLSRVSLVRYTSLKNTLLNTSDKKTALCFKVSKYKYHLRVLYEYYETVIFPISTFYIENPVFILYLKSILTASMSQKIIIYINKCRASYL